MPIQKKSSFLVPTPPNGRHLFMVITDPDQNNCVLTVNITDCDFTLDLNNTSIDKSCILTPGCHEFINKLSRVNYADALEMKIEVIENEIAKGTFRKMENISDNILHKTQEGCRISPSLPRKYKRYFSYF